MGVNFANLLILPKIAAMVSFIPVLVVFSIRLRVDSDSLIHRHNIRVKIHLWTTKFLVEYYIWQAIFKAIFFAFVISSVASYYGYKVKRGSTRSRASQYRLCRQQRYRFTDVVHSNFILMIEVNNIYPNHSTGKSFYTMSPPNSTLERQT